MPFKVSEKDVETLINNINDVKGEIAKVFWVVNIEVFCLSLLITLLSVVIGLEAYRIRAKYIKKKQSGC
jgi:hypothetical protein